MKLGAKDADGNYIAQSSESPYYVQLSGYVGDAFANKKREDFIAPPAEPTTSVEAGLFSAADLMEPTAEPAAPPAVEATEEVTVTSPTIEATEAVTTTGSSTVTP